MSEEVIKDMVEKLVSRVYELDPEVIRSLSYIELYSACEMARLNLYWAFRGFGWDYVREAYIPCAIAVIIRETLYTKVLNMTITDEKKKDYVKWFTDVIPPTEHEKIAKEVLRKLEESIKIAQYGIIKKKYG
jgi:hypothetical protein